MNQVRAGHNGCLSDERPLLHALRKAAAPLLPCPRDTEPIFGENAISWLTKLSGRSRCSHATRPPLAPGPGCGWPTGLKAYQGRPQAADATWKEISPRR